MAQQAALQGDNVPFEKLQQIKAKLQAFDPIMSKTYQEMDAVRGQVVEQMIRKVTPENIPQLWNTKIRVGGKDKFSLKEIYPNVDIAGMSVTDFKRFAWPAMIENTSATFRNANLAVYENTMEEMNNIAGIFGKSLDDIAGNAKAGDSVINVLLKARNNAIEIEEAYAWERFFRQQEFAKDKTIRLVDAVKQYQKDFPDWMGDVNKIVAEVNDTNTAKTNIAIIAKKYGFGTVTEKGVPLDKKLLNIINAHVRDITKGAEEAAQEYKKLEDVPQSLAEAAFKNSPHAKPVVEAAPVVEQVERRAGDARKTMAEKIDALPVEERAALASKTMTDVETGLESDKAILAEGGKGMAPKGWHIVNMDVNGLGKMNDVHGHDAGDALLKGVGDTINDAIKKITGESGLGGRAFRIHGDELELWMENEQDREKVLKAIDKKMEDIVLVFEDRQGITHTQKGFSISYGTGISQGQRETALEADKARRVRLGQRPAVKGSTLAPSIVDVSPPKRMEVGQGANAAQVTQEQLTLQDALAAIRSRKVVPPYDGRLPGEARTLYEGIGDAEADIAKWSESVISEWGKKVKTIPTDVTDAMKAAKAAVKPRMDTLKLQAAVTGVSTRNFVLHDYNKTYLDHALTYTLGNSFHYWTTRTYMRSMESLVDNPKYANAYMAYKEYNTKRHSDQPDWYRQNLQFDSLMGIPLKNPLFVNFEQAVNPMYGLTGTDFNDPRKRVDWATRMVDDMNKLGPTFSPLVSWAVALHAYSIGEEEAGQRWAGRAFPQTQIIKSASSALLGKPIETDPFVLALDKGVDPYEKNRVVASLASMVRAGEITQEQMVEASRTGEGPIWEAGIQASATARFGGDATSFFLGAGIRPRTQNDMVIEKFWKDYSVMVNSRSMLGAEEYREAWDKMRDNPEYGQFMDSLLLSRKSGDEMDTAYAYNVLGRLPPGQLNDALKVAGIDQEVISAFYDSKGDWDKMDLQPQERQILMGQIVNIASVYKMPSNANRKDYNIAKKQYAEMNVAITQKYGEGMLIKMNEYWNDPNQSDYLERNPDVKEAMAYKDQIVVNNPKLMQYYGGMFTLERYYVADAENQLAQTYGKGIADKVKQYNNLLTTEEKSAFLKANSKLKTYQAEYADADTVAAKKLEQKWGNMEYALQEYKSEKALRDPEYKKEIAKKYKISAYNKELNKLTKAEREAINAKYGEELVMDARSYSIADAERKDELEKKYSPLQAYMNDRAAFMKLLPDRLVELGTKIPDTPAAELRPDQPNPANKTQRELQQLAQPAPTAQQWTQALGEPMMELIQDYDNGAKLPQQIRTKLERDADKFGYMTGDEMLQAILISLQ